ncbi:hypothetical protein DUNSADRAFT_4261 [Dunaliella salina]|uniref:Uncharacterized protein n=1 Tax=Dunaliella salina TaxID=3046 RepID=A0ABQ7GSB9_DUNSA|nr:hypothetical protein DUNSADRAFT_4261 [Dunaliella salina]|eukprot:KAF5837514.1 hypothetical protein DUNSADRAFT_4261 [Dunaliella salina]
MQPHPLCPILAICGSEPVPHPFDPILATCGSESVVRLWSPEAEVATKLSTSQLATATLNMMEGDNLPEEEPADPMPGVAGWAELVSRHFGHMAGAFEAASPGRGMGRAATGRVRQRRRDTEEETEGRASASAAPTTDAHAAADSDGDQANGGTDANARRPPEGSSPARGSPFPCRFM